MGFSYKNFSKNTAMHNLYSIQVSKINASKYQVVHQKLSLVFFFQFGENEQYIVSLCTHLIQNNTPEKIERNTLHASALYEV